MLSLPITLSAQEAVATRASLTQQITTVAEHAVVIDASALQYFDSAALAVLLECQRTAHGAGKTFETRHASTKLAALAKLYGINELLGINNTLSV
jgi:phospholipid transport system transporter-binding protein